MNGDVARRLVEINAEFYRRHAADFAETRRGFQPGFRELVQYIPIPKPVILDVGCGNGRFGRFVESLGVQMDYTGLDFSRPLLEVAGRETGRFMERDLSQPGCLAGLDRYSLIVALSTIQHIPGTANRQRLLREMGAHLSADGHIVLANWQFLDNERQARKIRPWSEVGLRESDVESGDYLLSWGQGQPGLRYVAHLDEEAVAGLAQAAGLRIVRQFRSDGREGNLNLYSVLRS